MHRICFLFAPIRDFRYTFRPKDKLMPTSCIFSLRRRGQPRLLHHTFRTPHPHLFPTDDADNPSFLQQDLHPLVLTTAKSELHPPFKFAFRRALPSAALIYFFAGGVPSARISSVIYLYL
jgi:hypothetical protein